METKARFSFTFGYLLSSMRRVRDTYPTCLDVDHSVTLFGLILLFIPLALFALVDKPIVLSMANTGKLARGPV